MRSQAAERRKTVSLVVSAAAFAAALACGVVLPASTVYAQQAAAPANGQMLVEADRLVYDNDSNTVTAAGNVRIAYDGRRIVAQRVVYNRNSSRLMAYGNVQMVDRDGTQTFGEEVDISDDFREGFVNALRVETTDKTYFASESATRRDGNVTTFNSGVYTACEPCEENPDKAPIWRIKSRTIIWDGKAKTIRFVRPRLELFGFPIATFPALTVPDHTVKRKSGFLFPGLRTGSGLGVGISVPYYHVFSPSMDLTTTVTGFTRQGFLGEVEFRRRFESGEMSVKAAGIYQMNPDAFATANAVDRSVRTRGMIGTKGRFQINPKWTFGWDILAQSDKRFSASYGIDGYNDYYHTSEIYLTGLNKRNYLDLRFQKFQVQENVLDSAINARHPIQPWVLPSLDYSYTPDEPIAGGELNIDFNLQGIHRGRLGAYAAAPDPILGPDTNVDGVAGTTGRATLEAEWKRQFIAPGGLVVTPMLHGRTDAIMANYSAASAAAIVGKNIGGVDADIRSSYYRAMATAGLDVRWPVLFSTASATHVLEPIGQIFVRPNEPFGGTLGIPNEDAQSLVFDATTLFERDKFSGYDRMEGGIRANLGLRYAGQIGDWTTSAIVGQSFHLAGVNSFAQPDLVNVGAYSGLETTRSDYVAQIGAARGRFRLTADGRFDETTAAFRRGDITAVAGFGVVSASARYSYIQAQPLYGFARDRHEVTLSGAAQVAEYWRVFGSGTYDFESKALLRSGVGFTYDDECFTFTFTAAQSRTVDRSTGAISRPNTSFGVQISLRTIGDFGTSTGAFTQGF